MTAAHEVRRAAAALKAAIEAAVAAGYRVAWPASAAELDRIAVSETGRVVAATDPRSPSAPSSSRRRRKNTAATHPPSDTGVVSP